MDIINYYDFSKSLFNAIFFNLTEKFSTLFQNWGFGALYLLNYCRYQKMDYGFEKVP